MYLTGEMLIKNFIGAQLPFSFFFLPPSLLLFFLPLFPHLLFRPRLRKCGERLSSLAGPSGAWLKECNFSDNHTITLSTAQSAAPAGGRPVRPLHVAPPRAATAWTVQNSVLSTRDGRIKRYVCKFREVKFRNPEYRGSNQASALGLNMRHPLPCQHR